MLSAEQQLRRLARLTPERALAHPSMAAWRGVLALLLLWDTWPQDGAWPALELVRLSDGGTAFSASVTAALSPARAPDGLWVFTLRGEGIPARPSPFSPAPWPWCPPPTRRPEPPAAALRDVV